MQANFPSRKKYFIILHKAKESFLLCSQDPAANQNVILQLTDCTIEVPIVELQPEKQEEERKKIGHTKRNLLQSLELLHEHLLCIHKRHNTSQLQHSQWLQTQIHIPILTDHMHKSNGHQQFFVGKTKFEKCRHLGRRPSHQEL